MTGVNLVPHIMEGTKRKVSNGCFGGQFKNKVHLLSVFHAVECMSLQYLPCWVAPFQNIANILCYIPPRGQTLSPMFWSSVSQRSEHFVKFQIRTSYQREPLSSISLRRRWEKNHSCSFLDSLQSYFLLTSLSEPLIRPYIKDAYRTVLTD